MWIGNTCILQIDQTTKSLDGSDTRFRWGIQMITVKIENENWKREQAPWVSNTSDIESVMVRFHRDGRWRRVFFFSGVSEGRTLNGKKSFRYVKRSDGEIVEVILPPESIDSSKGVSVIRPCPFCSAIDVQAIEGDANSYILCSVCGASGPRCPTKAKAYAEWNMPMNCRRRAG